MTSRRTFLQQLAGVAPLVLLAPACGTRLARRQRGAERATDLLIVGGSLGGCAAALAACEAGLRVILTEETDWIGGQLTAQAVPPDENQWIESYGGTRRYQALRQAMRDVIRARPALNASARRNATLNPGNGWVSRVCVEPRVALAAIETQLAPHVASGRLTILRRHVAIAADVDGARVRSVRVRDLETGREQQLQAAYVADATDTGMLLPLTGTEYVQGAESSADTTEPHAKARAEPDNVQSCTMCFAMDYLPGEDHTIDRPTEYDRWRAEPLPGVPGFPLIGFGDPESRRIGFDPVKRIGYWSYRRIIDRDLYAPGTYPSDVTIVNWAQNDYTLGSLLDGTAADAARHIDRAKQQSLSLLYWLQTEAPRPDGGAGWRGLRLRPDIVGTTDGLAKAPYIRESRRIRAEFTVLEQHVLAELRMAETRLSEKTVRAQAYPDSVGIGHYAMDIHRTTRGDHGGYGTTLPFQIPLGALLPQRMENMLPACKNLGVTHLTNGCFRLHPIEWNIGESVGQLVAFALAHRVTPRAVRAQPALLASFQQTLTQAGVRLSWPAL